MPVEGKTGEAEPENAKHMDETQEASEASRDGSKEQWLSKSKK